MSECGVGAVGGGRWMNVSPGAISLTTAFFEVVSGSRGRGSGRTAYPRLPAAVVLNRKVIRGTLVCIMRRVSSETKRLVSGAKQTTTEHQKCLLLLLVLLRRGNKRMQLVFKRPRAQHCHRLQMLHRAQNPQTRIRIAQIPLLRLQLPIQTLSLQNI